MKKAVISNEIVIMTYPKKECAHVNLVRIEDQTVTVVWKRCD